MSKMLSLGRNRLLVIFAVGLAAITGGVGVGYLWGASSAGDDSPGEGAQDNQQILYWYDPMVPDQHFDEPGKSPFMDMDLVPRYAGEAPDISTVSIDPAVVQNLGVRLTKVTHEPVATEIRVSGTLSFNERDVSVIQSRTDGFVERTNRLAVGDVVRRGELVAELRSPEWSGALAEYLSLQRSGDFELASAARSRLTMLGLPESAIAAAESADSAPAAFEIRSQITGAVTALGVKEGMNVSEGMPLATINGLSPVWLIASVPQRVSGQLMPGNSVDARLPAFPGETFTGVIESILPQASASARTVEVRVALENADGRLRPGMTAEVDLSAGSQREVLLVAAEAVIRTGTRSVVIVSGDGDGRFTPTEVRLGQSYGDRVEITAGLQEGQSVVSSGQFLIDSEASLSGVMARLSQGGASADEGTHVSTGSVVSLNDAGVTIAHEPVPSLNWPSMTMHFDWGADGAEEALEPGDEIDFRFSEGGAGYVIEEITPKGDRP